METLPHQHSACDCVCQQNSAFISGLLTHHGYWLLKIKKIKNKNLKMPQKKFKKKHKKKRIFKSFILIIFWYIWINCTRMKNGWSFIDVYLYCRRDVIRCRGFYQNLEGFDFELWRFFVNSLLFGINFVRIISNSIKFHPFFSSILFIKVT